MIFYYTIFFVLLLASFTDLNTQKTAFRKIVFWVFSGALIFIGSIRWNTGGDWANYKSFFEDIDLYYSGEYINPMEFGFTYLNYIIAHFSKQYTVLLTILSILTIGLKANSIYRYKDFCFITLLAYFSYFLGDIVIIRQFLALSITMFSTRFVEEKKLFPFLICVFLASSIHVSSIVFILAYWIYHFKWTKATIVWLTLGSLVIGISNIGSILIQYVVGLSDASSVFTEKLQSYNEGGLETSDSNPYVEFAKGALKRIVLLPVLLHSWNSVPNKYKDVFKGYLNLLTFGNVVYFVFIISIPALTRLSVPFGIYELFLWGMMILSARGSNKVFIYIFFVIFCAFRLNSFVNQYPDLYIPFETIFDSRHLNRDF